MPTTIKALSMWQPWASLVGLEAKKYETRSWSTNYRGPLLICSSKKKDLASLRLLREESFQIGLHGGRPDFSDSPGSHGTPHQWEPITARDLPYGEAIAIVDLVDVFPTERYARESLGQYEFEYGDFAPGRFAWKLENVRPMARGWRIRGFQGLFNVELPTRIQEGRGDEKGWRDVLPSTPFVCPNKGNPAAVVACQFCDGGNASHPSCDHASEGPPEPKELDPRVVSCPTCNRDVGAYCQRPSGHRAMDWHKARIDLAIEAVTELGGPDAVTRTQPWGLEGADED